MHPEKVLTWAAWWRGVTLLAKYLAKCPCEVFGVEPNGKFGTTPALTHPAYRILRWKANEVQTAFQFRLALAGHAINRGNGYAHIGRVGPVPTELILLDPDDTEPVLMNGAVWYVYKLPSGEKRKLPAADVFHLRGFGFDGIRGYPLWQMAKESISLGLSAERFRGTRYKNSARPSVILETPNKMHDQAMTRLREDWERIHTGLDNSHRTAILDNGLKASKLSFSPEEMQEVESAGLLLRDAANFLGVPSSKLGDTEGVKYASKEQDDLNFIADGLDFWLVAFEDEAREKLLSESEKDGNTRIVSFDRESLVSFDLAAKANYYRTATGGRGWMSPAEVREELHLEPRDEPDIDRILTPLNMGQGGQDNRPRDLRDSEPGRPAGDPGDPNDGDSNQTASLYTSVQSDGSVRMSEVREAARVALTDASRRMVRRCALHSLRAANDPKKWLGWVEAFEADHVAVMAEAFSPVAAIRDGLKLEPQASADGIARALCGELRAEYLHLADTVTAAKLFAAVERLNGELETRIPRRMCELFLGVDHAA